MKDENEGRVSIVVVRGTETSTSLNCGEGFT